MALLKELEQEVDVAYSKLVVVSTDTVQEIAVHRAVLGAGFSFLSDAERRYQRELEMVEFADRKHNPITPADFVLYPDLTIHKVYNGYYFWGRATLEELRQDFRFITSQVRWDWDPGTLTPEMFEK